MNKAHNRYARGPYGRVWGALNETKVSDDDRYQNLSLSSQTPPFIMPLGASEAVVKKSGVSDIATCRVLRSSKLNRRGFTCSALRSSKSRSMGDARIRLEDLG